MDEDGEPLADGWPEGFGPGQSGGMRKGYSVIEALNWYSYVSNNPVKYVDPTGMVEVDYDDQGNATIQGEIENRGDITEAVSLFYDIAQGLPEGDHRIQFINKDGEISGDYSLYSDAMTRLQEEWPDEIKLTIGVGLEVANLGVYAGVGDSGPSVSFSYLLGTASVGIDSKGKLKTGADIDFTLIGVPGLKVDFSFTAATKNYWRKQFNKEFSGKQN